MNQNKLLHKEVFKDNDDFIDYFFENIIKSNKREILVEGELVSAVYWKNMFLNFQNKIGTSIFLTSITTKNSFRRKGYVRKLLNQLINESTVDCILLHPFNHSFYEKLGFITINYHSKNENILSKLIPDCTFTKIDINDASIIYNLYEKSIVHGTKRDLKYFEEMITYFQKCGDLGYLILNNDIPIGYYFFSDNRVIEFVVDDSFKLGELVSYQYFSTYNDNISSEDKYAMGRIINVKKFFSHYKFSEKAQNFSINVLDSININNHKKFTIKLKNQTVEQIEEHPLDFDMKNITVDIADLTAIAFGNKNAYTNFLPLEFLDNFYSFGFTLFDIY